MVRRCRLINVADQSRIIVADTVLAWYVPSTWQSLSSYITWITVRRTGTNSCCNHGADSVVFGVRFYLHFVVIFFSTVLQVVSSESSLRRWHDAARYGDSVVRVQLQVWRRAQLS